jgi:hypothetical protein
MVRVWRPTWGVASWVLFFDEINGRYTQELITS